MPTMNAFPSPEAAPPTALPAAPAVWTSAHYFHRIHDPVSFAWLNSLDPKAAQGKPFSVKCFGMDVVYCKTACKTFQISGVISVQKLPPWVV